MGVSKTKMLILHITGPNCPDLDMVDLPGLVSTHVRYVNSFYFVISAYFT